MATRAPRTRPSPWHGTVLVASGHALYVGPAGDTKPHRHHALQLVVALEEAFEAQLGLADARRFESLLIAADCAHRIEGRGLPLGIYYVDGSCEEGRILSDWLGGEKARVLSSHVGELRAAVRAALAEPGASALPFLRQRDLSARFRKETGLTMRRYLLWVRLKAAVSALAERKTLTQAAHAVGFADAAHLSRTFVQMFRVAPSESLAASEIRDLGA